MSPFTGSAVTILAETSMRSLPSFSFGAKEAARFSPSLLKAQRTKA